MTSNSVEQKAGTVNIDENNQSIEKVNMLLEQVQQMLTTIDNTRLKLLSAKVSIDDDGIRSLAKHGINYSVVDIVNMFEMIVKSYLQLLDINQPFDVMAHRYLQINKNFARVIIESLDPYGLLHYFLKMTSKVQQKLYYRLLDQVSSSKIIISFLNNELSLPPNIDEEMKEIVKNSCQLVLIIVLRILRSLKVKLLPVEFEKSGSALLSAFCIFIDEFYIKNQRSENDLLIDEIILYLGKTSSDTSIIPILINCNCPQACLRWLSSSYLNGFEYSNVMCILYNIARHDEGAIMLNKSDCQKILYQFERDLLNTKIDFIINKTMYKRLLLLLNMIIALIVNSDKLQIHTVRIIMTWFSLSKRITFSKSFVSLTYDFHIAELLIVMAKLCANDVHVNYILKQHQVLQFFFTALKGILPIVKGKRMNDTYLDSDILAIIALANILWSISFHDQYRNDLIQNLELLEALDEFRTTDIIDKILTNSFIPHQMASLRRAIDGICHNLYLSSSSKWTIFPSFFNANKSVHHLMISYSHRNIEFCRQLYDRLSNVPNFAISVDIINGKYLWEEITQTMEESDIILFLISTDFFHSKSCRQELIYVTDTLKKPFIPVFIDADYKTTGWLDTRITASKYIRFGRTDFMNTCDALLSIINENLSLRISSVRNPADIKQWNDKEVKQWFTDNNILPELCEFYQFQNGYELLRYAEAILAFPWINEYDRIRLRFEEKFKLQEQLLSQAEFLKFINALECLPYKTTS